MEDEAFRPIPRARIADLDGRLAPPLPDFGSTGGIAFLATSVVEGSRDDSIVSGCKLNFSFRWWSPDWGARVLELTLVNVSFVPFCRPRMDVLSLF